MCNLSSFCQESREQFPPAVDATVVCLDADTRIEILGLNGSGWSPVPLAMAGQIMDLPRRRSAATARRGGVAPSDSMMCSARWSVRRRNAVGVKPVTCRNAR